MRLVGLWILLVAVYAATLGIPAQTGPDYAGNEPHHLLAAESIVSDRDVDLADEYAERSYASWYPRELQTDGQIVGGRLVEPHGVGFALLIAPAYAIGGARAVQGEMLALLALAFVLGAALARRMVPEPWATAGAALVGLSPPALAASTTITPGVPGGGAARRRRAVRAGGPRAPAAALRVRRRAAARGAALAGLDVRGARRGRRLGAGRLDAARAAPVGGPDRRRGARRLARLLRDRQRPLLRRHHAARGRHRGAARPALGYIERLPRLAGLWLDREAGLLRWAPLLALVFFAGWLLYRSRRDQLARVAPARREAEACAALLLGVVGVQVVVVAMLAGGGLRGAMFPGCRW